MFYMYASISLVVFATKTKATQNTRRRSLHSKTTLIDDAHHATHVRHASSISTANMIYNGINLSAKGAIYLHLAQSVGTCSFGTCTILLNENKARLWIASCDVKGA